MSDLPPHPTNIRNIETIIIEDGLKLKPGAKICDGFVVGKVLSHGVQGEVSLLVDEGGHETDWLLKVTFLRNAFDDMEREWKIGRVLNLLNNPTFMFTGPCIRSKTKKVFAGMFIRRIDGVTCDKIVGDSKFADIRWLRKCMFTVLMALDEAQKLLGFHHFDFRLGNIMVTGSTKEDWVNADKAQFKIIDFGLGSFDEGYALIPNDHHAVATLVNFLAQRKAPERSDSMAYQVGSSLSNNISALLSALPATGSQVVLGISSSFINRGGDQNRKPSRVPTPGVINEEPTEPGHETDASSEADAQHESDATSSDTRGEASMGPAASRSCKQAATEPSQRPIGEVTSQSWSPVPFAKGDPVPQWITTGIFKGYRQFWQHRGDLLYLCLSLVANLDYHIWPTCDAQEVHRLMNLIHHVTGIRLKVRFEDDVGAIKSTRARRWFHIFRTIHIRGRTLFKPYNSGISAAEALCAPFFLGSPNNPYSGLVSYRLRRHSMVPS